MSAIFISYSHKDSEWKQRLRPHIDNVGRLHGLKILDDSRIRGGEEIDERILAQLQRAVIVIVLLSAHYLNSEYIRNHELPWILRSKKENGTSVVPILVRPCLWEPHEWINKILVLPANGQRPLVHWPEDEVDDALNEIAGSLHGFLEDRKQEVQAAPSLSFSPGSPAQAAKESIRRTNILDPSDSIIGRDREVETLRSMLQEPRTRLVTLTGAPGIGKTRLAQEVGLSLLDEIPGGCWFADLVESDSAPGIAYEIGEALGRPMASSQTGWEEQSVESIRSLGPCLIILDNFEQIVEFAEVTVGLWLRSAPEATLLVTSRLPLKLPPEQEFQLSPLEIPPLHSRKDEDDSSSVASVSLFIARSRRLQADFEPTSRERGQIEQICRELEGIPLAIELAAARLRMMSPAEIADKLSEKLRFRTPNRGDSSRHQTLGEAIDWSFNLLSPEEKRVFLELSIFRDGFFLNAANAILTTSPDAQDDDHFDLIQSLVEHNLLRAIKVGQSTRFQFYVSIREYAERHRDEWIPEKEMKVLLQRWAAYYIDYAKRLDELIHTDQGKRALDSLGLELENIFGIHETFIQMKEPVIAAEAILAFAESLELRGPATHRIPKLKTALEALPDTEVLLRSKLSTQLSIAYWARSLWNEAEHHADNAVRIARQANDPAALAKALQQQGAMRNNRGYLRRSLRPLQEAKAICTELNDDAGLAATEVRIGSALDRLGNLNGALGHFMAAEQTTKRTKDLAELAMVYNRMGLAFWHHGHLEEALKTLLQAEEV